MLALWAQGSPSQFLGLFPFRLAFLELVPTVFCVVDGGLGRSLVAGAPLSIFRCGDWLGPQSCSFCGGLVDNFVLRERAAEYDGCSVGARTVGRGEFA